ncbi:tRNA (adenine(22)-N(1))-methyltransferase [Edaphobacillus lindanitolerans]|uniref:tRNA (Adenine22-N1)-methyltransferase n=1 Tax=Edaphobacillus lindanitolerans TaxID=550447 RepID=A0A1U7PPJ4_9BACI|nr:tRNA (adenine(22)-N(1))-methyltransferase TrmK [Edaphobacillus lindanitolerans]SIT82220.1 tRNA (adenine22-N1)-methyltransferase [Edaphobacillus lindanitolerans]
MNAKRLSGRLAAVAAYVDEGASLADIGSDHAYLPCHLALSGKILKGIAGEVAAGPYESAVQTIHEAGLGEKVQARLADGLAAIRPEDRIDTVSIAGMGGPLIASILENGKERLEGVSRLILQPNINARSIREWGMANGWVLAAEEILKEDGKIYEVLVLERGEAVYGEKELLFGPFLMTGQNEAFREKWERERKSWQAILRQMEQSSRDEEISDRKEGLRQAIHLVTEVLGDGTNEGK